MSNVPKKFTSGWWKAQTNARLDKYWKIAIPRSKFIVELLRNYDFSSIYEIGFFSGRNLYYIQQAFPGVRIGGADVCPEAVPYANKKLKNAELSNLDVSEIGGEKWDIVFTCGTLIHVPHIDEALESCVEKARKYVIHIEGDENDKVLSGPKSMHPDIVSNRFEWLPNIHKRYINLGLDVTCEDVPESVWARDASKVIIVKL